MKVTASRGCRPLLELLEERDLMSFGTGGIVITDAHPASSDEIRGLALQGDGKIVAGGVNAVARYNADGSLDGSFNPSGSLPGTIALTSGSYNDLALHADGKVVTAGSVAGSRTQDFLVRRYTTTGTPDTTFGTNGQATYDNRNGTDELRAVAVQPGDQKIVAVGVSRGEWTVVRYTAGGSLDATFDRDGLVTTTFGKGTSLPAPEAVAVVSGGKILVAGRVYAGSPTG